MWGGGARPSEPVPDTLGRHEPIDAEEEEGRLALWFFALILFLGSGWFAWDELRYAMWGHNVEAHVLGTSRTLDRHGIEHWYVEYEYPNAAGLHVKDYDSISNDWEAPGSGTVTVTYLSGDFDRSRLSGHRHYLPICIFAAGVAAILFVGIKWLREAEQAVHEMDGEEKERSGPTRRIREPR